eukprot:362987-Chlamydomonas_euryale.AAC.7
MRRTWCDHMHHGGVGRVRLGAGVQLLRSSSAAAAAGVSEGVSARRASRIRARAGKFEEPPRGVCVTGSHAAPAIPRRPQPGLRATFPFCEPCASVRLGCSYDLLERIHWVEDPGQRMGSHTHVTPKLSFSGSLRLKTVLHAHSGKKTTR